MMGKSLRFLGKKNDRSESLSCYQSGKQQSVIISCNITAYLTSVSRTDERVKTVAWHDFYNSVFCHHSAILARLLSRIFPLLFKNRKGNFSNNRKRRNENNKALSKL